MDIIEQYIKTRCANDTDTYKDEIRAKFKSVDHQIIDFADQFLDIKGQELVAEILKDYVHRFIKEQDCVGCDKRVCGYYEEPQNKDEAVSEECCVNGQDCDECCEL